MSSYHDTDGQIVITTNVAPASDPVHTVLILDGHGPYYAVNLADHNLRGAVDRASQILWESPDYERKRWSRIDTIRELIALGLSQLGAVDGEG